MNVDAHIEQSIRLEDITFCKYQLTTVNKNILLTFPQLLQLRANINKLGTHDAVCDIIESDNFVLLFVADKKHLIYLDIPQLLALKATVSSFFASFKSVLI
ncbi:hypothetical protein BTO06_15430 [Tenacibaculum sp. SZ-18]|uniref:hypothetical protein n=1 Tax=Tenacibaculum sp. SZ-18 TaxID=754423 RepID=UPI000C2D25F8|nr:hypothetical protein [Tenacibaculum sp. SZ-18]AUC16455.1 hypothetical protein BTO06_15430 [Tenacibaculum sp. SZ-18]